MNPIKPKNATRVFGEEQGYIPLPVRDEAVEDVAAGYLVDCMVTNWMPTADELNAIISGKPIRIRILGNIHPPIIVDVEE